LEPVTEGTSGCWSSDFETLFALVSLGRAGGGFDLRVLMKRSVLLMLGFSTVGDELATTDTGGTVEFNAWVSFGGSNSSLEYTNFPTIVKIVPNIIQPSKSIASVSIALAPGWKVQIRSSKRSAISQPIVMDFETG
jgi:hypothetical protein